MQTLKFREKTKGYWVGQTLSKDSPLNDSNFDAHPFSSCTLTSTWSQFDKFDTWYRSTS